MHYWLNSAVYMEAFNAASNFPMHLVASILLFCGVILFTFFRQTL